MYSYAHVLSDRSCTKFPGEFDDYKDDVLARLGDEELVEVEGRRVVTEDAGAEEEEEEVQKEEMVLLF